MRSEKEGQSLESVREQIRRRTLECLDLSEELTGIVGNTAGIIGLRAGVLFAVRGEESIAGRDFS